MKYLDVNKVSPYWGVILLILFAIGTAEADQRRGPERGVIEQIQNQNQGQRQTQEAYGGYVGEVSASSSATNAGNSLSIRDIERKFRTVVGLGAGDMYSQGHSDTECQRQKHPELGVLGIFTKGEKVYIDEDCVAEKAKAAQHQRDMAFNLLELEKLKQKVSIVEALTDIEGFNKRSLCIELGFSEDTCPDHAQGGDKGQEHVTQEQLTETVGRAFEKSQMK